MIGCIIRRDTCKDESWKDYIEAAVESTTGASFSLYLHRHGADVDTDIQRNLALALLLFFYFKIFDLPKKKLCFQICLCIPSRITRHTNNFTSIYPLRPRSHISFSYPFPCPRFEHFYLISSAPRINLLYQTFDTHILSRIMNPEVPLPQRVPIPAVPAVISVDALALQPNTPATPLSPSQGVARPQPEYITIDDRNETEKTMAADRVVLEYLRKRGFKRAEEALMQHDLGSADYSHVENLDLKLDEADVDDDLRNVVMMLKRPAELAEHDSGRYEESYCELRDWIDGSLDIYKAELHTVLYPLLVHCFLEIVRREHWKEARAFLARSSAEFTHASTADAYSPRAQELMSLMGIATPQHLQENQTSKLFLSNRYEIHLSHYAFELIMYFLADDPRRSVLLRILNQRCRVRIDETKDGCLRAGGLLTAAKQHNANANDHGFVPSAEKNALLRTDVLWGRLRPDHYIIPDGTDPSAPAKGGKSKPKNAADKGKGPADGKGKADPLKKDPVGTDDDEEPLIREDGTISVSRVPLKKYRYNSTGIETSADRKQRANLTEGLGTDGGRCELAILCYTFTNTRDDELNCSAVSDDGSQVAAGFGDSTVRIWDAKRTGTASSGERGLGGKSTRLVGHSGPVYSVDWTHCSRFVLSGSEDGSIRLWNTALKTDLVAYHGHNYPVWSASFCPLDHYFASGGHDRTARVWSTDRISPLRILAGHLADVDVVRWHPNCNYIGTGSSDRTARLWDIRDGKCVRVFGGHKGTIYSLAFSPDGRTMACGGDGRTIDVWDIATGQRLKRLAGHSSTVWTMDYSQEGAVLASGGADQRVCIWRASDWCKVIQPIEDEGSTGGPMKGMANGTGEGEGDVDGDVEMNEAGNGKIESNGEAKEQAEGSEAAPGAAGTEKGGADKEKEATVVEGEKGGDSSKPAKGGDIAKDGKNEKDEKETSPLVKSFDTKETPIHMVKFTRKNVLIAVGNFET